MFHEFIFLKKFCGGASISSFGKSFKTLFWDMFGYGEMDDADLVVQNTCRPPDQHIKCFNTTKHRLTEATGYTMRAVYHIVAIIILVNALIALMSNTLSRVQVREPFFGIIHLGIYYLK